MTISYFRNPFFWVALIILIILCIGELFNLPSLYYIIFLSFILLISGLLAFFGQKRELAKSKIEQSYKEIIEEGTDIIWETDTNGTYTFVSANIFEILGYTSAEWVNTSIYDWIAPEEKIQLRDYLLFEVKNKKKPFTHLIKTIKHKDGSWRTFDTNGKPIFNSNDDLMGFRGINRNISDRMKFETGIRRLEKEKALILESIKDAVVFYNPQYKVIWANKSAQTSELGYNTRHTSNCCRIWEGNMMPCENCAVYNAMSQQQPHEGEIKTPDGKYWHIRAYPVFDDGEFMGIIEFSADITLYKEADILIKKYNEELEYKVKQRTLEMDTLNIKLFEEIEERKSYEKALLQNINKFRSLLINSPDGIVLTDENGYIVEWNNALENIYGISKKNALGCPLSEIHERVVKIDKFKIEEYKAGMREVLVFGQSQLPMFREANKLEIITPDGVEKVVQSRCFAIPMNKNYRIASIVRDITNDELLEKTIRQSESKLRTVFDNTFQGFILLDMDGKILEMNQSCRKFFRLNLTKNIKNNELKEILPPYLYSQFNSLLNEALETGSAHSKVKVNSKNQKYVWFDIYLNLLKNKENQNTGIFINAIDINEPVKAEDEIRKALEMEKELSQLRARFVSSVSHEFRTPLSSIYSNVQLLQRYNNKWDEEKKNQVFQRIVGSIHHMTSLIKDVSMLGKGQAGMYKFQPEETEIINFCNQVAEDVSSNFSPKPNIIISSDIKLLNICIDANLIRHILVNLLNNAVKYSPENTPVNLTINCKKSNWLELNISDKGIGIPEEDLLNIYNAFYRAGNVSKISGSGLGMAVVKQCVDTHNGEIEIKSKIGEGTSINVGIPYTTI
jgi:PAS domain S-box-containing protein